MKPIARYIFLFPVLILFSLLTRAQISSIDSLKKVLLNQKADTNEVLTLCDLSHAYQLFYPDSSFIYAKRALELAEKLNYERGIFWSETCINGALYFIGNYPLELENAFKAFLLSKKLNSPLITAYANGMMSDFYLNLGEYDTSLSYWRESIKIARKWFPEEMYVMWINLSRIYGGMNQPDSAMYFAKKGFREFNAIYGGDKGDYWRLRQTSLIYTQLGNAYAGKENFDSALSYYHRGIPISSDISSETNLIDAYNGIAAVYKATGRPDSAIGYAQKVINGKIAKSYPISMLKAANLLADIYELKDMPDSTLKYLRMTVSIKDSLFNRRKLLAIQDLTFKQNEKQQRAEATLLKLQNRYKLYVSMAGLIMLMIILGIFIRRNRQRQLQKIRNGIADDLHDDIGSALSSISIMSELARKKPPETMSLLASIGESSASVQENMSDIVWAITSKNDRFENVVQRMKLFSEDILNAKNIELDFKGDSSLSDARLTMEKRKNCYLFYKEVINNAAKYSKAEKVTVRIFKRDRHIEMNIIDNGRGFDTTGTFNGNGMNTLRKRAAELNGDFKISSQINNGTEVQLVFKIT